MQLNQQISIYINLFKEYCKQQIDKLSISDIGLVVIIITFWSLSLFVSSSVFNRPLDIDAHHEYLTAHTLVSLRALDQWGIGQLLGASVLVPKSMEYLQADITIFDKGDGVYLSYPSLWLVVPYIVFKIFAVPISVANLQIYHLICDRLFSGLVIYFLFLEIIRLFEKIDFLQGWGGKILAIIGTSAWMFIPAVLYWSQNVYFCDQAVLLPIYGLILLAVKQRFQFNNLSRSKQIIIFALSLCAAGFDWYGWIFLLLLMLTIFLPLIFKNIGAAFRSIMPIVAAITVISIWFTAQLIYYKDGWHQITNIALERVGANLEFNLSQDIFVMSLYWHYYLPQYLKELWDAGKFSMPIFSISTFTLLIWLCWHSQAKVSFISTCFLILAAPLLQIVILKQHSTIHDFSAFKLALPTTFIIWIVTPIAIFILVQYLIVYLSESLSISLSGLPWLAMITLGTLVVFTNQNVSSEFVKFAASGEAFPREVGAIVQKHIAPDDLPISDSPMIFIGVVPPQPTWYANRFVYTTQGLTYLKDRLHLSNLNNLNPVFLSYEDEVTRSEIEDFCHDSWQSIPETIMNKKVHLCRSKNLKKSPVFNRIY
jgi:hypothetical protein